MLRESSYSELTKSSYSEFIKSSHIEYSESSNDDYQHSLFNNFTKTIISTLYRILIASFLNAATLFQSKINNNKIVVKSTVIKTFITKTISAFITKTISAKIITKTHIHSTTFITIVTISLLCTCDENKLSATDDVFFSFQISKFIFFTKTLFLITTSSHVMN